MRLPLPKVTADHSSIRHDSCQFREWWAGGMVGPPRTRCGPTANPLQTHRKTRPDIIRTIFGRTDLRISLSRAKFDEEADFEVRSAMARPKPCQIDKKRNFRSEIFVKKKISVEKRNVRSRPKRVLAKFRAALLLKKPTPRGP